MKTLTLTSFFLYFSLLINAQQIDIYQRPIQHERNREFDAIHYRIALDVDMEHHMLSGSNTITLSPLNDGLETIILDAVSLVVTSVMDANGIPLSFKQTDDKLSITLSRSYSHQDTVIVSVTVLSAVGAVIVIVGRF